MRSFLSTLQKINNAIYQVAVVVSAILLGFAVLVVSGGGITRYVTGRGFSMVQELPPMLMPWIVFPLAGALIRTGAHITVDLLPTLLDARMKRVLNAALAVIALIAGFVFCTAGMEAVDLFWLTGQVTEMEVEFPIWWIYLSFPVGFAILMLAALEALLSAILGETVEETAEEAEAQTYGS